MRLAQAEAESAEGVERLVVEKWNQELARQDGEQKEELMLKLYETSLDTGALSESLVQQQVEVAVLTEFTKELQQQVRLVQGWGLGFGVRGLPIGV